MPRRDKPKGIVVKEANRNTKRCEYSLHAWKNQMLEILLDHEPHQVFQQKDPVN